MADTPAACECPTAESSTAEPAVSSRAPFGPVKDLVSFGLPINLLD